MSDADRAGQILQQLKQQTVKVQTREGETLDVTPEQAHAGFGAGQFGYIPGEKYYVRDEVTGAPVEVDSDTAARTSAQRKYTAEFAAPAEAAKRQAEAEYGGFGSQAATFGEAALDELTLGGAAVAGRALGGDAYANRRALQEEVNPLAQGLGTATGLGVGLLYGAGEVGGAAKGAGLLTRGLRAAGSPTRALLEAGAAAERGAGALGAAAGLAEGGLGARMLGGAARGALEGAVFSAGSEAARQAIHDPDLDGERLLSAGLQGALFGGALSAAVPLAGAGLSKLKEGVEGRFQRVADRAQEALEPRRVDLMRQEALKSTGTGSRLLKDLTGDAEALSLKGKRTADRVLYEAERDLKKPLGKITREEGLGWAESRRAKAGGAIGDIVEQADSIPGAADATLVELRGVVDRMGDRAVVLGKSAATKNAGRQAVRYLTDLAEELEAGGVRAVQAARVGLDDLIKYEAKDIKPLQRFYRQLRGELETVVESSVARAERAGAPGVGEAYRTAKAEYADFSLLRNMYEEGVGRLRANRIGGLSEQLALSSGGPISGLASGVGAAAGGLIGGLPGAWVGSNVAGAFGRLGDAALQRSVKARGSAVAAQTLRDLPQTGLLRGGAGAARQLAEGIPAAGTLIRGAERLAQGQGRLLDYARPLARAGSAGTKRGAVAALKGPAQQSAAQQREQARAERALAKARVVGETLAAQVGRAPALTALAGATQAAEKRLGEREVPPAPGAVTGPQLPDSDVHAAKVQGRRVLLRRPETVLARAADGTLTADQIDTLGAVMPKQLAIARANAEATLAKATRETPMDRLVAASLVLGRPADPSLQPHVLGAVQASLQAKRAKQQGQQQGGPQPGAYSKLSLPRAKTDDGGAEPGLVGGAPI